MQILQIPVVDPGFPGGGARTSWGGVDSRGGYISKILYVETRESGPLGGLRRARPLLIRQWIPVNHHESPQMITNQRESSVNHQCSHM